MGASKQAASSRPKRRDSRRMSLLYLVLLGFALAMLPILVMIYQAAHDVSRLAQLGEHSARAGVDDTRRAQSLGMLSSELDRVARQYVVINNQSLLNSYRERLRRFSALFEQQAKRLDGPNVEQEIRDSIAKLRKFPGENAEEQRELLAELPVLGNDVRTIEVVTNDLVDTQLQAMRNEARDIYATLWIELGVTLLLTLAAIIFFTWRITHPIRQLEQQIRTLEEPPRDTEVVINGPAELVSLNQGLNWLGKRLDDLEAQKRSFLRHMSHELKTPLAAIREGTGLLADGMVGALGKRQREIVLLIDDSSAELQILIEQLLDYNQTQRNRTLTVSRFDVVTLIHEIVAKHRLALESKGQLLEIPRRPVYWQADRVRTTRVIDNLVSNVIAYGNDHGTLWVRVWTDEEWLYVEIANTGNPISAEEKTRLFEPFFQGSSRRKGPLKGSGIGLSVASESALIQGGRLQLVDDAQEDVCFRLMLPQAQEGEHTPPVDTDNE
ncbi:ATP-binding protein [Carnimonas bestiolae]|uniref:sensor histidine kinase n=1 Tax=Carnimonas bestiolae TaxID=3402172 RepID=UPI003EDB7EE3